MPKHKLIIHRNYLYGNKSSDKMIVTVPSTRKSAGSDNCNSCDYTFITVYLAYHI